MVRVYRNLTRGCYSVMEKTAKGWRVAYYCESIRLVNAKFVVSKSGRARVLREKRKNVHAFIEGKPVFHWGTKWLTKVSYNPYKSDRFETEHGFGVNYSPYVMLNKKGCFIDGIHTRLLSVTTPNQKG